MADILTEIENGIEQEILSIRKSNGYINNWGSVNEPDATKQVFPSAEIILMSEECQDEEDGVWAGGYNQHANYMIRVRAALDNEESIPLYSIQRSLNSALSDLKRKFGTKYTVSNYCDTIMYKGMTRITDNRNDVFRPKYMETLWLIKYTQDRKEPTTFSN
jgi:hypothetical protein